MGALPALAEDVVVSAVGAAVGADGLGLQLALTGLRVAHAGVAGVVQRGAVGGTLHLAGVIGLVADLPRQTWVAESQASPLDAGIGGGAVEPVVAGGAVRLAGAAGQLADV